MYKLIYDKYFRKIRHSIRYLIEALVDKSPDEVVVTDNGETFYIISKEVYINELNPFGYEIATADGE
ncbi:hypothetical protein [Bacillus sp. ISL-46]|uniref:hypothetical protein n=1 Tax=Bacillus sp. ISL-46 TaxID=2819129 RepID=UPI001BEBEA32|nr:hypothetical protein [Bacillus sp. ISL-46]MBT2724861.1 hypothetical protein [Bacillus sp. ISL-46]